MASTSYVCLPYGYLPSTSEKCTAQVQVHVYYVFQPAVGKGAHGSLFDTNHQPTVSWFSATI